MPWLTRVRRDAPQRMSFTTGSLALIAALLIGCGGGGGGGGGNGSGGDGPLSDKADLSGLVLSLGALTPAFDPAVAAYTARVATGDTSITIQPTADDATATILVDGMAVPSGSPSQSIPLATGLNPITVVVTAEDGSQQTYTIVINRPSIALEAYIKAANTSDGDHFGTSVAIDGDTLVVGANFESSDGSDPNVNTHVWAGAAYVYVRSGTTWTFQALLKAPNADMLDEFGRAVAVSGDTIAVGAPHESSGSAANQADNSVSRSGAVYVFTRSGTTWSFQTYLKAMNPGNEDFFGNAVALQVDTLVVGAPGEDSNATGVGGNEADNNAFAAGAAYAFQFDGTSWSAPIYLKASNTDDLDAFGSAVAVSDTIIVVGAPGEDSNATGVNPSGQADNSQEEAGAVYVFFRNGPSWIQEAYIKASNADPFDRFGASVTCWTETMVIGAPGEDSAATSIGGDETDNSLADTGAAYVFDRVGGAWSQTSYIKPSDVGVTEEFGVSLQLFENRLIIGAPREDGNAEGIGGDASNNDSMGAGAAFVFEFDGSAWAQSLYLKASNTDADDRFGTSVSLNSDSYAIGAELESSNATLIGGDQTNNTAFDAGAAYVIR